MKLLGVPTAFVVLAVTPLLALAAMRRRRTSARTPRSPLPRPRASNDLGAAQDAGYTIHVAELSGATCIPQAGESSGQIPSPQSSEGDGRKR